MTRPNLIFILCDQLRGDVLGMGRGQGPAPNDFPRTLAGELTGGRASDAFGFEPRRRLGCPSADPLVSPYRDRRWEGSER